jgi:hypothetical protein
VERRLSVALAAVGLLAALGLFLLGRRSPDDIRAVSADLDALIRETAAGVQARADTLAQLPRLGWAVATDENTMHDLTTDELAFRPHPGEHIEITQMRRGGGEPRNLLRLPTESDVTLPVLPGTHVVVLRNQLHVVTVVSVEPRQRANELVGILAVAKQMDTTAVEQRLAARGINAELRTMSGSITLAGSAPTSVEAKVALTGPAAEGAELVASNVGRARWPGYISPLVLLLSLAGAGLLWRRGATPSRPAESPFAAFPSHAEQGPPVAPRPTAPTPVAAVGAGGVSQDDWAPIPTAPSPGPPASASEITNNTGLGVATPAMGNTMIPEGAAPRERVDTGRSGRVEISLVRSGSVSLSPRAGVPHLPPPEGSAAMDPRAEEYRDLYTEFVKLRRTTGEPVDGLNVEHFIATLRDKRAQIMKQIPVKDVRFKLAFHNGKAAIRYLTVN